MLRRSLDLTLVVALTILALVATRLGPGAAIVRVPATLPLALALPGYALVAALLPLVEEGLIERMVLSVGLSIALTVLAGLVLNWTPTGLTTNSWTLLLAGTTIGAVVLAFWRRRGVEAGPTRVSLSVSSSQGALVALAALVAVVALNIAGRGAMAQNGGFTQLSLVPVDGRGTSFRVGVVSHEPAVANFSLRLTADGRDVRQWSSIELGPGERWDTQVTIPAAQSSAGPVEALLYRADAPAAIYRHARLWPRRAS